MEEARFSEELRSEERDGMLDLRGNICYLDFMAMKNWQEEDELRPHVIPTGEGRIKCT